MPDGSPLAALRAALAVAPAAGGRRPSGWATGLPALDAALPGGRLAAGAVHGVAGRAAYGFLVRLLGRRARRVLWVRPVGTADAVYPHGLKACGLDPAGLLLVTARTDAERLAAAEEGLRSGAVDAVVAEVGGRALTLTASRRLQLAAQAGGGFGFLLPGEEAARLPALSLASLWQIDPRPAPWTVTARWRVDLARCRNGRTGTWEVDWDAQTDRLAMAAPDGDRPAAAAAAAP